MNGKDGTLKKGSWVVLAEEFVTGGANPKYHRKYPAGTRGTVVRRDGQMLEVLMEDPKGALYDLKIIYVNKSLITPLATSLA